MTNVFGYIRFSGLGQTDGDSVARQTEAIEKFCAAQKYNVVRWFRDDAVSGEVEAGCRDGFAEMLALCGPATAQIIVVERADRLARTLMVSELACESARKQGVVIVTADSGTDLTNQDDPTRVLIRQVLGALSEWNKNVIVSRLAKARARKRQEFGKCEGRACFGASDPDDALTVSLIMAMRQPGHEKSFKEIAKDLDRRKRRTPEGILFWSKSTVHYIYTREARKEARRNKQILKVSDILS